MRTPVPARAPGQSAKRATSIQVNRQGQLNRLLALEAQEDFADDDLSQAPTDSDNTYDQTAREFELATEAFDLATQEFVFATSHVCA